MRLTPPVSALLPRETLACGLIVDGQYFPEGTDIGVPHDALHHDERIFADPFLFKPERWMVDTDPRHIKASEAEIALMNSAFCAFSVGRASCVGKILAYQEMSIILARILCIFYIRLRGNEGEGHARLGEGRKRKDKYQTWEGFVSTHEGPMVEFRRRC